MKADEQVTDRLTQLVRHSPEVLEWFEQWAQTELERLPYSGANHAIQAGRTQVLMEQVKFLRQLRTPRK